MATKKKLLQAAAGTAAAGGEALNVEEVFSTYLYTGNSSTNRDIVNGLDLSNEGGMIWFKTRGQVTDNSIFDTERGGDKRLITNSTSDQYTSDWITFQDNGFKIRSSATQVNYNNYTYVNWTFRKAPKFFDVVTWTGDGTGARTISHNLGSTPGSIIRKKTSGTERWYVWHRSVSNDLSLNETTAASYIAFNLTDPTSTEFTVSSSGNISGETHVAYLFAHNNGDGDFGSTADQDIIKCGSYTGSGSAGNAINLGFEPQWVLIKNASRSESWHIWDTMRGIVTDGTDPRLFANTSAAEANNADVLDLNPTGFTIEQGNSFPYNYSGDNYIYIAIRRGPMAVPESATDVFSVDLWSGTAGTKVTTGFPVDMQVNVRRDASNHPVVTRLAGVHTTAATGGGQPTLFANLTQAEVTTANTTRYWDNTGYQEPSYGNGSNRYASYSWRRAPNYFDVVAYSGNGATGRSIEHNLGVAPEMMWVKCRTNNYTKGSQGAWQVYHKGLNGGTNPEQYVLGLEETASEQRDADVWNDTAPTATHFTVDNTTVVNNGSHTYIAYLFASLDGVSKVFSVTKSSGSDASVNCGFSAGPRFVLLKRTDSTGDWYVWDSERGIVAGNDPYLLLNSTAAEVTSTDYIDPTSNGFTIVNGGLADGDYIGYAVA